MRKKSNGGRQMNVSVKKVTVKGFKGYLEEKEFSLGHRTLISGDNGKGKSSISEAISWAITGCDVYGNEKAVTRLVNDKKPKLTEVVLDFETDGRPQVLIRRKKGSSNEIYWNDNKATNNDLSKDLFKSKDVFLSIFNPYYFPSLSPKDAKQLLGSILKPVNKGEIFAELGEYLKDKLERNGFRTPETFLTDKRAQLKELEENIIFLEGSIQGAKLLDVPERQNFDNTELKKLNEELNVMQAVKKDDNLKQLQEDRQALITELQKGFIGEKTKDATYLKKEKEDLLEQYHDIKNKIDNLGENTITCDGCGNVIDLNTTLRENLEKDLQGIRKKGTAKKSEIAKVEKENEAILNRNNKAEAEWKNKLQVQITELDKKINQIKAAEEKANEEKAPRIKAIKEKVLQLNEEEKRVLAHNSSVEALEKQNEKISNDIKKSQKEIENSKLKITELKVVIDAGKQYNSIKLKKQSKMIGQYLDKVELQFEKLTSDGELKDDFKILYEGREFNKLSNAEKIKAGLEMSNFISNMLDLHFPVFIDNAESITQIPELEAQMIMAKVVEGKELSVEVLE
jgi:myosin heavy subunit